MPARQAIELPRRRQTGVPGVILGAQRVIGNRTTAAALAAWHGQQAVPGPPGTAGTPLDRADQEYFGTVFGHDFSTVKIHTDDRAAASAARVGANAYTIGQDIVFAAGRYAPATRTGRLLLAHELSHVIQQRRGRIMPGHAGNAEVEAEADQASQAAATGQPVAVTEAAPIGMTRQPAGLSKAREDIQNLQDEELESEYESLRAWLLDPANQADPRIEEQKAYLAQLEGVIAARNPQHAARARMQQAESQAISTLAKVGTVLPGVPHPEILPFLIELGAGMDERIDQLPKERMGRVFVRYRDMSVAERLRFEWGYIKGIGIGVWEEIKGLGEVVILPFKFIRWLVSSGADLIDNWNLVSGRAADLLERVGSVGRKVVEEIGKALRNPAEAWRQLDRLFQAMVQSGLEKANQWGRQAVDQVVEFFEQGTEKVGEGVGAIVGRILFNIVLLAATDAIGNLIKEGAALAGKLGSTVVAGAAEALAIIGRFLPKVITAVKWLGEEILTFLKDTLALLRDALEALLDLVKSLRPRPVTEAVGPGGIRIALPLEEEAGGSRALMSSIEGTPPRPPSAPATELPRAPASEPELPRQQPGQGLHFELTEKRAERLKRVAEALNDETKWGNISDYDRFRLGRVYDELLENLLRAGMGGAQKVEHYVAIDAKLIARLRAEGGRVLITEGRLAGGVRRFDMLEIDFNKGTAELIDLASRPKPSHVEKLLTYKRDLSKLLGFEVEAKEMYYTGEHGELLEWLQEVVIR